jgi:glucose-1-phosphate thymidylyltransferase
MDRSRTSHRETVRVVSPWKLPDTFTAGFRNLVAGFRDMDAVIPAAGRGSRLDDLADDRPKGLVEVAGRPLLAHVFETAVEAGATELVVIVGYEAAQIVDRFGDAFEGVPITYVHQRERLGLGHAVLQAEPHVDGPFLLVNGDNVFAGSVAPAVEAVGEADAALAVEEVSPEVAATTGVIETDEQGRVTGLIEKPVEPSSTLVTTGCYVLLEVCLSRVCAAPAVGRGRVPTERGRGVVSAGGVRGGDGSGGRAREREHAG